MLRFAPCRRWFAWTALAAALVSHPAQTTLSAEAPARVGYNAHVRPILSANCFYCHGPDEKHREVDLRLDQRDAAVADRDGHVAIAPGKPDESLLLARVCSADDDEVM